MALQIKEAVLQCGTDGEDSLTDEELGGLLLCLPNAEDVQRLRGAPKDVAQLGMAEQFMLAMMSIPQVTTLSSQVRRFRLDTTLARVSHPVEPQRQWNRN